MESTPVKIHTRDKNHLNILGEEMEIWGDGILATTLLHRTNFI